MKKLEKVGMKDHCEKSNDPRQKGKFSYRYRSNISGLATLINDANLGRKHRDELRKTPFFLLFEAILDGKITGECKKFDKDVLDIIMTFNPLSKKFAIGKREIEFTTNDVRLIFGIASGDKFIPKSYSTKPITPFVKRRFKNSERLTASEIREKTIEAAKGRKKNDYEDVARLLCLYTLITVFFSTTGPTIGWDTIKFVEDLREVKKYAWTEKIWKYLTDSIEEHIHSPEKVTGCAIALPYWLCEHMKILEPRVNVGIPRLVKWDLKGLNEKLEEKRLDEIDDGDVIEGILPTNEEINLIGFPYEENPTQEKEEDCEGYRDEDVNLSVQNKDQDGEGEYYNECDEGENTLAQLVNTAVDSSGVGASDYSVENESVLVSHLRAEIQHLNDRLKEQSAVISSLQTDQSKMQETLLEAEVHTVTQVEAFKKENSVENLQVVVSKLKNELQQKTLSYECTLRGKNEIIQSHLATIEELRKVVHKLQNEKEEENVEFEEKMQDYVISPEKGTDMIEQMESDDVLLETTKEAPKIMHSSFVKRLKNRERKSHELPEYTYEKKQRRVQKRKMNEGAVTIPSENQQKTKEMVIFVGDMDGKTNVKTRHPITFSLQTNVAKILEKEVMDQLKMIHELDGIVAVVWHGNQKNHFVSLEDINNLLRETAISNFSLVQGKNKRLREEMFDVFLDEICVEYNLLHFPLNHNNIHWTLLVYDQENSEWTHYNSLRPRTRNTSDKYFKDAITVKNYVDHHMKRRIQQTSDLANMLVTQDYVTQIFPDKDCAQQRSGSLDCGVYVCMFMQIISEHGHKNERGHEFNVVDSTQQDPTTRNIVPTKITDQELRAFRAHLISNFVRDANKSWPNHKSQQQKSDDDFEKTN